MKKYARIVGGKVDNLFETNNPIQEEFPADQLWVDVTSLSTNQIDYDSTAVNNDGVWTFSAPDPTMPSWLSVRLNNERNTRLAKLNDRLTATALPFKVELGIATDADKAYLRAHKQFCIDLSNVNKQPGYPLTVVWPPLP
ncbi:tail fiber assembly protein [Pseudomonas kribbensis]|uniref:tail fiber assembly protein n=1 Tax=Pseudomonas kribbensis TaxID=1628086 RepID=UPI003D77A4E6